MGSDVVYLRMAILIVDASGALLEPDISGSLNGTGSND